MKSRGICPASCGEFVQGIVKDKEYLSSYAIDRYSIVTLEERIEDVKKGPLKARKAIEEVFKYFNLPKKELKHISIDINSEIPISKGMASSTADIGATIKATLNLIGKNLDEYEISRLATKIEPTDSIYIKENTIFNPLDANVIKKLGVLDTGKVLILEPNETLSTKYIRKKENYNKLKKQNKYIIEYAFKLLEEGIKKKDLNLIGQACNISSIANENIHKKKYLNEIMDISKEYGAYGVNIAHSGTVVGILLESDMNEEIIKTKLIDRKINKKYKKIYTANIIAGGLRSD
ncbi:MAG: cobalamin biosynthesis protein [Paeniclostridium sordellii]|uniref:Cobalamin biosynthesis protein n=1 Tax=Paeniclostridium hominis TaxID=2764329 RepID=A0ABR7K7F7_9FIRM|nr:MULTISPECIES: cobalamin biosynthesis protein [Paeniclostridium]MBC6004971.1 cobalamin biosynthesis protein [Paeniclostridium hominis]MDU2592429.1 cobalamin biosynthesis protein [Paeniclostridium sordellii]